jgi:anti-sigma-K factor RskA
MSLDCPEVEQLAAEVALGMVSATERASALAHLRQCQSCQRLVDELSAVADGLLLLAPEAEPSIGFESRILAATGAPERRPEHRPERRPRKPWLRVAVAAVAALVLGSSSLLAGLALRGDGGGKSEPIRSALAVTANGLATCRVFAFGEERAWVFVHLETPRDWSADYTIQVTTANPDVVETLGELRLQAGEATLGGTVDVPAKQLRSIRVLKTSGELWYEAVFRT